MPVGHKCCHMAYFDEDFATVEYDEYCDAVVGRMTEFADGEQFREYMEAITRWRPTCRSRLLRTHTTRRRG
jgi:hypothetical protein